MAKAQADVSAIVQAKRAEEERLHKEKMRLVEEKLRQREAELKKLDDAKRERE